MRFDRRHYIIFAIMITEVLGFSLVLPFLPLFAQDLGANPFEIGLIIASFSLFQFFSAPVMGKLSDYVGRKPMLMLSQLSTFLSFIILGLANSLWMIILSRVIDGLLGSNQAIAQAYLSDISSKKDRSKAFGLAGMAFGAGFLVGPATGGFLSQFSYSLPAFLAGAVSFITILTTFFLLPETVTKKKGVKVDIKILKLGDFSKFFGNKKTAPLLFTFAAYVLALFILNTNLALFSERKLQFGASEVGFLLAYIGVINLFFRSPVLGRLIDLIGERKLTFSGIVLMAAGLFFISILPNNILFYIAFTLFAVGSALSRPLIIGEISRRVSKEEQGAISGITNSLGSIARIVGPIAGGLIINHFAPGILTLVSSITIALGLLGFFKAHQGTSSII
ncbi:MAG: MFS transporter [Candidatus Dojkabacteria bacterium]|nr:MFS transporter [Candidatus Dojkabacteria bacterium]